MIGEENAADTKKNAITIHRYARQNAKALGLSPELPVQAYSFRPVQRTSPEGYVSFGLVAELLQKREVPSDPESQGTPKLVFRGGSTVILDQHCNVLYTIFKRISNNNRLADQQNYYHQLQQRAAAAPYRSSSGAQAIQFSAIHRGF